MVRILQNTRSPYCRGASSFISDQPAPLLRSIENRMRNHQLDSLSRAGPRACVTSTIGYFRNVVCIVLYCTGYYFCCLLPPCSDIDPSSEIKRNDESILRVHAGLFLPKRNGQPKQHDLALPGHRTVLFFFSFFPFIFLLYFSLHLSFLFHFLFSFYFSFYSQQGALLRDGPGSSFYRLDFPRSGLYSVGPYLSPLLRYGSSALWGASSSCRFIDTVTYIRL